MPKPITRSSSATMVTTESPRAGKLRVTSSSENLQEDANSSKSTEDNGGGVKQLRDTEGNDDALSKRRRTRSMSADCEAGPSHPISSSLRKRKRSCAPSQLASPAPATDAAGATAISEPETPSKRVRTNGAPSSPPRTPPKTSSPRHSTPPASPPAPVDQPQPQWPVHLVHRARHGLRRTSTVDDFEDPLPRHDVKDLHGRVHCCWNSLESVADSDEDRSAAFDEDSDAVDEDGVHFELEEPISQERMREREESEHPRSQEPALAAITEMKQEVLVVEVKEEETEEDIFDDADSFPQSQTYVEGDEILRPPSRTDTEILDEEVCPQETRNAALIAMGIKVHDYAYTPLPLAERPPEVWFNPITTLLLHDQYLRAPAADKHRWRLSGKMLRRLLDLSWVVEEEAQRHWRANDWAALATYDALPEKPYPYVMCPASTKPTARYRRALRKASMPHLDDPTPEDDIYMPPDEEGMDDGPEGYWDDEDVVTEYQRSDTEPPEDTPSRESALQRNRTQTKVSVSEVVAQPDDQPQTPPQAGAQPQTAPQLQPQSSRRSLLRQMTAFLS